MPETLNVRVTRLETAMAELAEKMSALVDAQIRTETQLVESRKETDKRIQDLVSAIGQLISRMPKNGSQEKA